MFFQFLKNLNSNVFELLYTFSPNTIVPMLALFTNELFCWFHALFSSSLIYAEIEGVSNWFLNCTWLS